MSTQRIVQPFTSSASLLRFASIPVASSLRPCQHVLRHFSCSQSASTSSKRKMQTSTAFQPHTFDQQLPPLAQNVGIADASHVSSIPQVNGIRLPHITSQHDVDSVSPQGQWSNISVREKDPQKSEPLSTVTAPQPRPKPARKFKPRKAAMNLTPGAVKQLRSLLDQPEPKLIKVGVRNRGCSGLAYHLEYVEKPGAFDETVEQDGVQVLIDSKALFSIIGTEMDWVEDKLNQRFVFKNPNIKEQCGCGESFMV